MNSFSDEEFGCHFLHEGFTAKDILDQKISEVSSSSDKDAFYVADLGDGLKKREMVKSSPSGHPLLCSQMQRQQNHSEDPCCHRDRI